MSIHLRKQIASRIIEQTKLNPLIRNSIISSLELCRKNDKLELKLPLRNVKQLNDIDLNGLSLICDEHIPKISIGKSEVSFELGNTRHMIQQTLNDPTSISIDDPPKKYIVEFSSPNIAKPFHVGHLRSTIIGNFLSNLFTRTNNQVIKMNYLGDYGTQFGFLKVGIEMEGLTREDIKKDPLACFFKAYVTANTSSDPQVAHRAREVFERMENGQDTEDLKQWEEIRQYTLEELTAMYERLNVKFDIYEFESMYNKKDIQKVISMLRERNLLQTEADGKVVVEVGERRVPIIKSDSTTLYLARDVAAFLARKNRYQMDKVFYVVDNGQHDHFTAIKSVTSQLGFDSEEEIQHVKFGRIKGMSTRKGAVVFLKDILNEAKEQMFKKQQESATTKVDLSKCGEAVADILGISGVIVNDLKQRRQRDYDFNWNKILQLNGDTGVKLQYTHCRLFNVDQFCGCVEAKDLNLDLLQEPEAQTLIFAILKYPEIIYNCHETLEACGLVNYLFGLCNYASKALKVLNVKNAETEAIGSQRLLLFNASRKVLKHGIEILGLKVLNEM